MQATLNSSRFWSSVISAAGGELKWRTRRNQHNVYACNRVSESSYIRLLELAQAWTVRMQDLMVALSNEKDPIRCAEISTEIRVLKEHAEEIWSLANNEAQNGSWVQPTPPRAG